MKRTKPIPIKLTPARERLIRHVLTYYPHWKEGVGQMSNEFLLANSHPIERDALGYLLNKEKNENME